MIIHSPIFSGSINQAESAYANLSGSFSGSFTGVGNFVGLEADSVEFDNILNKPSLVSGSSQVSYPDLSNIPSGIVSSSAQLSEIFLDTLGDGVVSGSSQVSYPGLSNIPSGIVSGSSQVTPLLPSGVVSGSSQVSYPDLSNIPAGITSGSSQVVSLLDSQNVNLGGISGSSLDITGNTKLDGNVVLGNSSNDSISFGGELTSDIILAVDNSNDLGSPTHRFAEIHGVNIYGAINATNGIISGSSQVNYSAISSIPAGIVSGSSQVTPLLPSGVVSGSSQVNADSITNFDSNVKDKLNIDTVVSGSSQILSLVSIDEDNMSSNSDTKLPTQQSVKAYVDSEISALVSGSPEALNTLNELAAALGDDANFATTISTTIGGKVSQSLQIISGDGLTGGGDLTTNRTLAVGGTADRISVSADAVDIAATYVGQSSITTLGTITTGTWNGTAIANGYLANSTISGISLGSNLETLSAGTGVTLSGGYNGSAAKTISIGQAVGTGDTVQFAKVGVGGASDATYELKVTGDIGATGDIVAYVSSDERLKNNVEVISNPIEKVQALRGVTWEWNELASDAAKQSPNVGVIAQEVEKVLPQLVHDRENGFKGVDYAKLTGLLIEAIKEQQRQIDELKSKL